MLALLPSVADMQRCIERKKNNRGGGISEGKSRTEVEEAGGVWNPAAASSNAANLKAAAEQAALTASNAADTHQKLLSSNAPAAAVTNAYNQAQNAAALAKSAAANAAAAGAGGGFGGGGAGEGGEECWDHPDTKVLSLRDALTEKSPLAYLLLRWLLSA